MKTMNEADKNQMLDEILEPGKEYEAKVWGTIMADAKTMLGIGAISTVIRGSAVILGALSNEYCYVGVTEQTLNFVVVGKMDVSKVKERFIVKFEEIQNVKIKNSLIPRRKVIHIKLKFGSIKLSLVNNTVGSDLKMQREGIEYLCRKLKG